MCIRDRYILACNFYCKFPIHSLTKLLWWCHSYLLISIPLEDSKHALHVGDTHLEMVGACIFQNYTFLYRWYCVSTKLSVTLFGVFFVQYKLQKNFAISFTTFSDWQEWRSARIISFWQKLLVSEVLCLSTYFDSYVASSGSIKVSRVEAVFPPRKSCTAVIHVYPESDFKYISE